jgi:hypothetical protein
MSNAILYRIAANHLPQTKTAGNALIRMARTEGLSIPAGKLADLGAELAKLGADIAAKRDARRKVRHVPNCRPLAERVAAFREAKDDQICALVRACRKGLYRTASNAGKYAPGSGHTTHVAIGRPGVKSDTSKVWGKKWSATSSDHYYTIGSDWIETVYDLDLAVVDGMFTLCAKPVRGHGPELFAAKWVEQGRGTSLNLGCGYIARVTVEGLTYTYHANSARAALDGVQRKAKLKPARRKGNIDLDKLVRRHGDVPVYWQDARDCELCAPGIRNWCEAVGCSCEQSTVAEVIAGYKLRPLPEVITVIRRVVRDRHNRQPIDMTLPVSSLEAEGRVIFDGEGGFRIEPSAN